MKTNQTFHHSGNGLSQEVFNLLKLYKGDCLEVMKDNRKFIGIELDKKYFDVVCNRLGEYILDGEQKKCA